MSHATGPELSVVVATRNRPVRLAALLESLRAQTLERHRFEVLVVDDASDDGRTAALLERERDRGGLELRPLALRRRGGPAAARNHGWRAARAALIAFTDDDCVADPGWLINGLDAMARHPGAIVQGATAPHPREYTTYGPFSHTLTIERLGPYYETCNIFYPRELLEQLGGFDAGTFTMHGGEDTDLAWRAIRASRSTVFEERARVFHAVEHRGALGMLRHAAHWHQTVLVFARYPEIRAGYLYRRWFWKWTHYALLRFLIALVLPSRLRILKQWLARPYVRYLMMDPRRRASPIHAPYVVIEDLTELVAMIRGSIRYRTLVL